MIPLSRRQAQTLLLLGRVPQTSAALRLLFARQHSDPPTPNTLANLLTWLTQTDLARRVSGGFVITDMGEFYCPEARDVLSTQGDDHVHFLLPVPADDPAPERPHAPQRR